MAFFKRRQPEDLASLGNVRPPSRWRRRSIIAAIYCGVVALCAVMDPKDGARGNAELFGSAELWAYSYRLGFLSRHYEEAKDWVRQQIVMVQLTDETFDKDWGAVPGPPAPRDYQAKVVRELTRAGVRGIVYDMFFEGKSSKASDDAFVAALRGSQRTYIGCWMTDDGTALKRPDAQFEKHARLAHILLPQTEQENIVDRVVPVVRTPEKEFIPSLSLAGAMLHAGKTTAPIKAAPGGWQIGDFFLPVNANGTFNVHLWDKPAEADTAGTSFFPQVFFEQIYEGAVDDAFYKDNNFFKGKIAIIGDVTKLGNDFRLTARGQMAGMEIQAHAMGTLMAAMEKDVPLLRIAPWQTNFVLIVLMAALTCWGAAALRPQYAVIGTFVILLGYGLLNVWLFANYALYVHLIAPSAAIFLVAAGVLAERNFSEERQKTWMRGLLQRYVSPQVADYLVAHPEKLQLGGEQVNASVLFSDIRGFTEISRRFEAQQTVALLNEYLQAMTDVVFAHHGTLDKYMGDGIMVVFGAPEPYDDHARRAVAVAIDMQNAMQTLRAQWQQRGLPLLDIGVGIATGSMIAGNMGASQRSEFTVVGDTVNLASRIESLNKELHTKLLIHESTYAAVQDQIEARGPLTAHVKGVDSEVLVYEVLGWKE